MIAEAALERLPAEHFYGEKKWTIENVANGLGTSPDVLRKYLLVHRFVKKLSENHPERAQFLWSLPVGAAEAFKRWVERSPIEGLAAIRTAEKQEMTSRQIIAEEKASRYGHIAYSLSERTQAHSLSELIKANEYARRRVSENKDLYPRIPWLFEIDTDKIASVPSGSLLEWCGVEWLVNAVPYQDETSSSSSQFNTRMKLANFIEPIENSQYRFLGIISVKEKFDRDAYENEASGVIAKALIAAQHVPLVLINLPDEIAWLAYVDSTPIASNLKPAEVGFQQSSSKQLMKTSFPLEDTELLEKAWLAIEGTKANVVLSYPGIWDRVMFWAPEKI